MNTTFFAGIPRRLSSLLLVASLTGGAALASTVVVDVAPPAPRQETAQTPRPGYIWVPGNWVWMGRQFRWKPGREERARPGYQYHPPYWVQEGARWRYMSGTWRQVN